ncbi:MAG: MATE family efflux transporter [Planctomycetota bacterium]
MSETSHNPAAAAAERHPLVQMMAIALPSVVTMTSYTVMQFVDRLMVKEMAPDVDIVGAQGTAGLTTWLLMTFCVGVTGLVSSFVSQNLGAGKPERGSAFAWNSVWLSVGYWAVIMVPAAFLAPVIFGLYPISDRVQGMAVEYAQVSFAGCVFALMGKGMHNYFFGLHRAGAVMVAVVLAGLSNVFFNAVLIFGEDGLQLDGEGGLTPLLQRGCDFAAWIAATLGIPALGLRGAALGTVLGNIIEFGVPFAIFLSPAFNRKFRTRAAWRPSLVCMRALFRKGWPAGLMFLNEIVTWQYLMSVLTPAGARAAAKAQGMSDADAVAAGDIAVTSGYVALQWMHVSFMPAVGIAIATQAMVGKAVGAGDPDRAARDGWLGTWINIIYMGLWALLFVFAAEPMIGVFINSETPEAERALVIALGIKIMLAAAVFQVFDAMAITFSAALRGAGDTLWPGVVLVTLSWLCIVGGGHVVIWLFPETGGVGGWMAAAGCILLVGIVLMLRFMAGRWRSMSLVHDDREAGGSGGDAAAESNDRPA